MFELLVIFCLICSFGGGVLTGLILRTPRDKTPRRNIYSRKRRFYDNPERSETEPNNNSNESENTDSDDEMPDLVSADPPCNDDCCSEPNRKVPVGFNPRLFLGPDPYSNGKTSVFETLVREYETDHNCSLMIINPTSERGGSWLTGSGSTGLTMQDACTFIDSLRDVEDNKTLDVILNTGTGTFESMNAVEIMVQALLNRTGPVRVHVPYYTDTIGTMLALAANELYVTRNGSMASIAPRLTYLGNTTTTTVLEYTKPDLFTKGSWVGELAAMLRVYVNKTALRANTLLTQIQKRRGYNDQEALQFNTTFCKTDTPLLGDALKCVKGLNVGVSDEILRIFKAYTEKENF